MVNKVDFVNTQHDGPPSSIIFMRDAKKEISAGFWRKVILVPKVILRYGHLKFFLWTRKTPLRMASRCPDLKTKIGKNTQEIPHTGGLKK